MDHVLKTIEDVERTIEGLQLEIRKKQELVNQLCGLADLPLKYGLSDHPSAATASTGRGIAVRPDEFFNRPLATCTREALEKLRSVGRTPAPLEAIYDVLMAGGFDFKANREVALQGLSISIGKNSSVFVKLPNGSIGVRDWYGANAGARRIKVLKTPAGDVPLNGDAEVGDMNETAATESDSADLDPLADAAQK
jgi:hypothetical protein